MCGYEIWLRLIVTNVEFRIFLFYFAKYIYEQEIRGVRKILAITVAQRIRATYKNRAKFYKNMKMSIQIA